MRLPAEDRLVLFAFAFFTILFSQICQATDLQAISVPFGPDFLGYDGLWSPAQIRVGSPEQWLLVFPSTTSSETWVAGAGLCTDPTCASRRGGIFYSSNSTTWRPLGDYELGYSALTESTQIGTYGFDNISISDTLSAANQIVAVVNNVQQWNGQLGMGVTETKFTNNTNYLPFLSTLVQNNSAIPSHSYSYTAGASYKGSGIPGSLTLGGLDTTRYIPNNFSFTMSDGNIPSVALKSIQVSASSQSTNWTTNPLQLFSQSEAAMFTIDSSTPYLWLPEPACENIAQALSLSWDADLELYVFTSGTAQNLVNMGLEFTFNLANSVNSKETIALNVSYNAFNLQLSYPYPGLSDTYTTENLPYFPLRRANNTLQYTIGRAFLQEIYMIVDYESNSFSLSQALFPDNSQQPELVEIPRPDNSVWAGPNELSTSTGLSTGAKVGIAVAAILTIGIVAALAWCYCIRKRRSSSENNDEKPHKNSIFSIFSKRSTRKSSISSAAELYADRRHPIEMISDASTSRFELSATAPVEMAAGDVAPTFFQERNNAVITQRNNPRSPIELVSPLPRSSISKEDAIVTTTERSPVSAAPAYSPAEINQRYSKPRSSGSGVSPNSNRRSGELYRGGGSDHIISPITGNASDFNQSSRSNLSQSGSESSRHLSPISPAQGRGDGRLSPHLVNQQGGPGAARAGTNQTNRNTLSPIPGRNPIPQRSASRDSRFREDLMGNAEAQTTSHQPSNRSPKAEAQNSSRFSWEG